MLLGNHYIEHQKELPSRKKHHILKLIITSTINKKTCRFGSVIYVNVWNLERPIY